MTLENSIRYYSFITLRYRECQNIALLLTHFCVYWHDYVAAHGLKLNSDANMNHSEFTVAHTKWVFIPSIVLSVKARHIIPSYIRCSIIVLWVRKTPLSAVQRQVGRFVVRSQNFDDHRDFTFWGSLITYSFLDLATLWARDHDKITEVVKTQNETLCSVVLLKVHVSQLLWSGTN